MLAYSTALWYAMSPVKSCVSLCHCSSANLTWNNISKRHLAYNKAMQLQVSKKRFKEYQIHVYFSCCNCSTI